MSNVRDFKGITPKIAQSAFIDPTSVIIGDVEIGEESSIWCTTVIRGDVNFIRIGDRTNIQDASVLHVTHRNPEKHPEGYPLIIGSDVTVGHRVTLHGCTLEDCCFVGMNATVMDGAVVESEAMIGANALVTSGMRCESGYLYIGAPAKKFRPLTDEEKASIKQSANNYVGFSAEHK